MARWILAGLLVTVTGGAHGATIIEVSHTPPVSVFASFGGACSPACLTGQAAGWTQTSSYTNVTVEAEIGGLYRNFPTSDPGTGFAYLMRQLGPGTTAPAHEVAVTIFKGLPNNQIVGNVVLFTGLTLGPGSYYLLITGDGDSSGTLPTDTNPTITTAPGTLALGRFWVNGDTPTVPAYLPAQEVEAFPAQQFAIRVTGDPQDVPEPSSLLLMAAGLAVTGWFKRWRALALCSQQED